MTLHGKTCLVTGAAGGIGGATAKRLAEHGAKVAVCDLNEQGAMEIAQAIITAGGVARACCGDVSLAEDVEKMVRQTVNVLGPIEVLVNTVGISEIRPFLETTEQQWDRTIRINLKSVYLTCKAVLPSMIKRRTGIIVNISSQSGKRGASWYADYCASKFAIIGLTQSLAREFAREGIRVNAVCPGVIETKLWNDAMWSGYARKHNLDPDKVKEAMLTNIPLGRFGTPEDVANVVLFLASDQGAYMTGQAINITGGSLMI